MPEKAGTNPKTVGARACNGRAENPETDGKQIGKRIGKQTGKRTGKETENVPGSRRAEKRNTGGR